MYILLGLLYRNQDDFDGAHNLGMVRGGEDRTSEKKKNFYPRSQDLVLGDDQFSFLMKHIVYWQTGDFYLTLVR